MTAATKRVRVRLAKAELVMGVATSVAVNDPDTGEEIAAKYHLSPDDMTKLCDAIGAHLERWAIRLGIADTWDDDPKKERAHHEHRDRSRRR